MIGSIIGLGVCLGLGIYMVAYLSQGLGGDWKLQDETPEGIK